MDSMTTSIRLVLVDDDPMVRSALRMFIGGDTGMSVVGEAADGEEALEVVARERPDVVLMDIRMPVRDGLSATEALRSQPDPPRIIVLTTFDADEYVLRALRLGADGFLLKDTAPGQLLEAIRMVAAGLPMLSPTVMATLVTAVAAAPAATGLAPAPPEQTGLADLTERELEVAQAVARGLSNAEIAATLFMSVPTVKTHVGRLFEKLGVENRVQVAITVHDAQRD